MRRTKASSVFTMKTSNTKETSKGKALSKSSKTGKSATTKEPVEEPIAEVIMDYTVNTAGEDVVRDDDQPQDTSKPKKDKTPTQDWFKQPPSCIELEYNFQECFNALTNKLDWNNPEEDRYPFDLSKPLPLSGKELHYVYHKDQSSSLWHKSQLNKFSKHNVYSTQKIISVVSVKVERLHGYGHLDEIMEKRADRQLYKFKEGNFVDLHLNDIKDMLLLVVQRRLFHLNKNDIVDFIVALQSYQKKLNITAPQQTFPGIEFKELYTPSYKPPGVIYEDLNKQKRVMWADELYKFSDGTLKTVRDELHHRILDFRLGYNKEMSRRKWTAIDKRRSELMVELIDKQMRERRIIRNLERLVGARELEMDYRLMTYSHHGPSDAMHNPPQPLKVGKTLVSKLTETTLISIDFLTPRLLILKRWQSAPASDH
ncbi:hypothetical protein Tco_0777359 [Tanacetum coccineum]